MRRTTDAVLYIASFGNYMLYSENRSKPRMDKVTEIILILCCCVANIPQTHCNKLKILLVTAPSPGHLIKMAALGEELVTRGHTVTLSTTEREGSEPVPRKLADDYGMSFVSAGPDDLNSETFIKYQKLLHGKSVFGSVLTSARVIYPGWANHTAKTLDNFIHKDWDVVVVEQYMSPTFACYTKKWNIPMIVLHTTIDFRLHHIPPWSYPLFTTGYSENLNFVERLVLVFYRLAYYYLETVFVNSQLTLGGNECMTEYFHAAAAGGTTTPLIIGTVFGFEFARPVLPLVHYVGPLMPKTHEVLPTDLQTWLDKKKPKTVIYISMGSTASLTPSMGKAILDGILSTECDAVWSLRKNNRDILEGLTINTSRFFISTWVPQRTLLESDRLAMFIGHGGMGGITESLCNSLPVIAIPFNSDQWDTAARIKAQGLGIVLDRNYFTASDITVAVETLRSTKYIEKAKKVSKIFSHAGGTKKAADLIEYYVDVGYEYLVPANLTEQQWNWMEFYNIETDIYVLTMLILLIFVCCCLKRFCYL